VQVRHGAALKGHFALTLRRKCIEVLLRRTLPIGRRALPAGCTALWHTPAFLIWQVNRAGSFQCSKHRCRVFFCLGCGQLGHQQRFCRQGLPPAAAGAAAAGLPLAGAAAGGSIARGGATAAGRFTSALGEVDLLARRGGLMPAGAFL